MNLTVFFASVARKLNVKFCPSTLNVETPNNDSESSLNDRVHQSITPIYKKGDPQLLDNYRPVSVIPIFGKIFEKVIYNRLYSFFSAMNVIYDKQFGFRKNHSTKHAVNYSVNHLFEI